MQKEVILNIEDFLNDFQYFKVQGLNAFHQAFEEGDKLVLINATPYDEALMLEIQLAWQHKEVERLMHAFYGQESNRFTITYQESFSQIECDQPKRTLIQNRIELSKVLAEVENFLIRKGFKRLDRFANIQALSNHLEELIFKSTVKPTNVFKLCQRSYLLRFFLGEKMTESVFYNYYEQLTANKIPDHQLEEFLEFNSYVKSKFT